MKKLILSFILVLVLSSISWAATSIALVDNTLVTDAATLRALSKGNPKAIVLGGTISDTFAIYEDGVLVKTITLAAASEKWVFTHMATSYKIDFSVGTDTAQLICGD